MKKGFANSCHCRGHLRVSAGNPVFNKDVIRRVSFPRNVIGNLQKLFVVKKQIAKNSGRSPIETLGDDNFIYQKGFTLIELLVVVLIIGILAAVALPQYQAAVEKGRATQMLAKLKAIEIAETEYRLANGKFTHIMEDLSIDAKLLEGVRGTSFHCGVRPNDGVLNCYPVAIGGEHKHFTLSMEMAGGAPQPFFLKIVCVGRTKVGDKVCLGLNGRYYLSHPDSGDRYYIIRQY